MEFEKQELSEQIKKKIANGLARLNKILPLKVSQDSLSDELQKLHRDMLHAYVDRGRSLNKAEISELVSNPEEAINTLREKDLVVFDESNEPIGAYPFTMEEREHQVRVNGFKIYSMCAMDALSISPMFKKPLEIHSQCRISQTPIVIKQNQYGVDNLDELSEAYFAINWNAASANTCCADSLCTEMIFVQGYDRAQLWLEEDPENREIYTLPEAIFFGAGFFVPLVQN